MDHGGVSSFLMMTGLTWEAFSMLHDILKPPGNPALLKTKGHKVVVFGGAIGTFDVLSWQPN